MNNMKRQTAVRQSSLYSAPLIIALFSILLPGRLVALDLELMRVGGYDTSGQAWDVAVSGNYAYVADGTNGLQVIDVSNPANPQRVGQISQPACEHCPEGTNENSPAFQRWVCV
jgi:hypothetical protein